MNKYFTYTIKDKKDKNYILIKYLISNNINFSSYYECEYGEYITFCVNNDIDRKLKLKVLNNLIINSEEEKILEILSNSTSGVRMQVMLGYDFDYTSKEAKKFSIANNLICSFDFNGIICLIDKNTNLNNLHKYYNDAHFMKWTKIGPICDDEYDDKTKNDYEKKLKKSEEESIKRRIEEHKKEVETKRKYKEKIKGISIELLDEKSWEDWKSNNTDSYGNCIFEYAEGWAKLMQSEAISKNKEIDLDLLKEVASKTSFEMDFLGISGSMYYAARSILVQCWKYGNLLKEWSEIDK